MELIHSDKIDKRLVPILTAYCANILKIHGANILSIAAHGSLARDEFVYGKSDINLVIICTRLPLSSLMTSRKHIKKHRYNRVRIREPLYLTRDFVASSAHVFPIEFFELKEHHLMLYGDDFLSEITVDQSLLRNACERQLKGQLIRLRQYFLTSPVHKAIIRSFLHDSLTSMMSVFRNVLRVQNKIPPSRTEDVLMATCATFDIDQGVFIDVLYQHDPHKVGRTRKHPKVLLARYINQIQKLSRAVARM